MNLFSALWSAAQAIHPALSAMEELEAFVAAVRSELSHGSPIGVALHAACAATKTTIDDEVLAELEAGLLQLLAWVDTGCALAADAERWLNQNGPTAKQALRTTGDGIESAMDAIGNWGWWAASQRARVKAAMGQP